MREPQHGERNTARMSIPYIAMAKKPHDDIVAEIDESHMQFLFWFRCVQWLMFLPYYEE